MEITDISGKAREIYERDIKAVVEPEHYGEFLVLDVLSGGYVVDSDSLSASKQAREKFPNGVRFGMRIGYRNSGSAGSNRPARRGVSDRENGS